MGDPFPRVDHVAAGLARLVAQFRTMPNIVKLITAIGQAFNPLEQAIFDVYLSRTLAGALNFGTRGPSGTGAGLTDNTAVWSYLSTPGNWGAGVFFADGASITVPRSSGGGVNVWVSPGLTSGAQLPQGLASLSPAPMVADGTSAWILAPAWAEGGAYSTNGYAFSNGNVYQCTSGGVSAIGPTPLTSYANASLDNLGKIVGEPRNGRNDAAYSLRIAVRILLNRSSGTGNDINGVFRVLLPGYTVVLREIFPAGIEIWIGGTLPLGLLPSDGLTILQLAKAAGVRCVFVYDNAPLNLMLIGDGVNGYNPAGQTTSVGDGVSGNNPAGLPGAGLAAGAVA